MKTYVRILAIGVFGILVFSSCSEELGGEPGTDDTINVNPPDPGNGRNNGGNNTGGNTNGNDNTGTDNNDNSGNTGNNSSFATVLGRNIDLNNLENYANQGRPGYINRDNTRGNQITDAGATLGRVLFYDTNLSTTNTISCASCHTQSTAFGDRQPLSQGVNGRTSRHSMRLVNARFAQERRFFWDERANTLETQTTMPIQDHIEMGFSGQAGNPDIQDLVDKLDGLEYYETLFERVYGDSEINETRMQNALAQFVRSIQSFDSKYDEGRARINNDNANFLNFTDAENRGKALFNGNPRFQGQSGIRMGGGLGCDGCHRAPDFDIDPGSDNNGVIAVAGSPNQTDPSITKSPSLRDIFAPNGQLNGPLMHTGSFDINEVIDHYNSISNRGNNNLDRRLARGGGVQLRITQQERQDLIAFLRTLTGSNVYTNDKWSNPF